jgi:hypothetical protein
VRCGGGAARARAWAAPHDPDAFAPPQHRAGGSTGRRGRRSCDAAAPPLRSRRRLSLFVPLTLGLALRPFSLSTSST